MFATDETVLPWPVRVCEWREGIVELVMSGCVDMELGTAGCVHLTNQSATLHWYCHSDHCKLDLRLAIRKELKKVLKFTHVHTVHSINGVRLNRSFE